MMKDMNLNYRVIKGEIDKINTKLADQADANGDGKKFSLLILQKFSGYKNEKLLKYYSDGPGDHQIDGVYMYEGKDELVINIITCVLNSNPKATFKSKDITDFLLGLDYLFFGGTEPSDMNEKIKEIKTEIGEQKEIYENNYSINIKFVSSSDSILSSDSKIQFLAFQNAVTSSGVDLMFEEINGQNIAAMFSSRVILNTSIPVKLSGRSYYPLIGKEGFVCRLPVDELIKIYFGFNDHGKEYKGYGDYLFTDNIRKNLGLEKKINRKIYETAIDESLSENFEYFNNGLTILYNEIAGAVTGDSPLIFLKGLQVVNGCQTVNTLIKAHNDGKLCDNIYITCRFIKRVSDEQFVQSVITYTNSQSAISDRDLHANDQVQYSIQTILKKYKIFYERKLNEFRDSDSEGNIVMDALDAAQAFLCCELQKPDKAKQQKRKLFGLLYEEIFDAQKFDLAYKLFASYLTLDKVLQKQIEHRKKRREVEKKGERPEFRIDDHVIAHGSYHIAARLYQKWFNDSKNCEILVQTKKLPKDLDSDYESAVQEIVSRLEFEKIKMEDIPKYFKAYSLL